MYRSTRTTWQITAGGTQRCSQDYWRGISCYDAPSRQVVPRRACRRAPHFVSGCGFITTPMKRIASLLRSVITTTNGRLAMKSSGGGADCARKTRLLRAVHNSVSRSVAQTVVTSLRSALARRKRHWNRSARLSIDSSAHPTLLMSPKSGPRRSGRLHTPRTRACRSSRSGTPASLAAGTAMLRGGARPRGSRSA